jgi:superfamily II DNA or RNA helicase/very-short-patch-repair endonuclease
MEDFKGIDNRSNPEAKLALFRSLFRGREDVFARRFESRKTGKSGYSPVCENEWARGICEKPRVKCASCPHRRLTPLTVETIRFHLTGQDDQERDMVAGVYPMLQDETCFFLAFDFDKAEWLEDVRAVLDTCRRMNIPAALERSRSGAGGHVWFFFEEAISAALVRRLGAHILTETMDHRPDISLGSYDRLFPNQDTLPRGGFGNLIALPLQKSARATENSVFIDNQGQPYPDQWAFLSSVERISKACVEQATRDAIRRGRVISVRIASSEEDEETPWTFRPSREPKLPELNVPLPDRVDVVLGDQLYIAKEGLPAPLRNRLRLLAAFQNPEFYKAQAMRLSTYDKPRVIDCSEDHPQHLALPRGCLDDVRGLLSDLKIKAEVRDERFLGEPLDTTFRGELRPDQKAAAEKMMEHDTGVLAATTAFGKTVVAAWLIAQRGVNALVLVHRRQLLEQWIERLSTFLDLPETQIGRIGGGKKKPTGRLDVALIQSLVRKGVVNDYVGDYGHLIVDECHHLSASSFELVARRAKAKYVIGLSATVTRKDGHHPIIFMQCGPIRHHVLAKAEAKTRPFEHIVIVRPTSFRPVQEANDDHRVQFQNLIAELTADEDRNHLIRDDVAQAVRDGRSPLVLTERTTHLELLAEYLKPLVRHVVVLRGGTGAKATRESAKQLKSIPDSEDRVIVATGRYVGEGFDDPRLDTLFVTLPVSWRGTVTQYVGRLHRLHEGKTEVRVYDYADLGVPMLARMFDRRCDGYEAAGYAIHLPGSAVPGWPIEVPLPIDARWKSDYSTSVRRLIRDGVDAPLARLFANATKEIDPSKEGSARARSATEAFLFRRLETLPETAGRFRLNEELPISFDGWGKMECDLYCEDAAIVVELDGDQHLEDKAAYRRDRRKDALLQEHGFFVLRFLASDVGCHLDNVLDTILRTLVHQGKVKTN